MNVKKSEMEIRSCWLLERLTPRGGYMTLFKAVVQDVWNAKHADAPAVCERKGADLAILVERRNRSFDLYADSRINEATYLEQSARLDRQIKEIKEEIARLEPGHLNVAELLGFAETVAKHAAQAWADSDLVDRIS